MFPLVAVIVPDFSRGESASGAARLYSATRANVETAPLTATEAGGKTSGRRGRRQRSPLEEPDTGNNLDIEV